MKNGFTITQRNAVVEQYLWCIDTVMAQYAAWMQAEPIDPDDVYQSLAVRLIRAVNSYDPRKGYLKEYILSQLKWEMVRVRSTQAVYGLTQAPANIGSTIVPLTIAAQRESYWETYIAVMLLSPFPSFLIYIFVPPFLIFGENFRNGGLRQRYRSLAKFRQSKREAPSRQCCTFLFFLICPAISGTYPSSRK